MAVWSSRPDREVDEVDADPALGPSVDSVHAIDRVSEAAVQPHSDDVR